VNGGEIISPRQVYLSGIGPFSSNAERRIIICLPEADVTVRPPHAA
jgi:hypothetical protein